MKTTPKSPKKKASTTKSVKAKTAPTNGPEFGKIVNITPESHPAFHKMLQDIAAHAKERKAEILKTQEDESRARVNESKKEPEPEEETSQMDDLIAIQAKAFKNYLDAKADVEHYRIFLQSELNKIN